MKNASKHVYENNLFSYIFKNPPEIYTLYINQSKNHIQNLFHTSSSLSLVCMLYVCLYVTTYVSSATPRSTTGKPCSRSWAISVVLLLSLILPSCRASSGSTNCQTGTHNYQIINVENVYWQCFLILFHFFWIQNNQRKRSKWKHNVNTHRKTKEDQFDVIPHFRLTLLLQQEVYNTWLWLLLLLPECLALKDQSFGISLKPSLLWQYLNQRACKNKCISILLLNIIFIDVYDKADF